MSLGDINPFEQELDTTKQDEIDALFAPLKQQAATFDAEVVTVGEDVKALIKSFNMKRFTLRSDKVGLTYLQGLPSHKLLTMWEGGNKIAADLVIDHLATNENFRFKQAKNCVVNTLCTPFLEYKKAAQQGKHGNEFITVFNYTMSMEGLELKDMYKAPNDMAKASYSGQLFIKGIKEYVTAVQQLMSTIQQHAPEGAIVADLLVPRDKLQKANDEWSNWATLNGVTVDTIQDMDENSEL